ncbi:MAG: ribonuclease HII, partial [Clostridiaceae bacterium]|nr:ribonuclease HII [Clostridiaceae bacterium]
MEKDMNFLNMNYKEICEHIKTIENAKNARSDNDMKSLMNMLLNDNRKTVQKLGSKMFKMFENKEKEIQRVKKMYDFDRSYGNYKYLAGVDEVGRGPLAGPIVAAAVILDLNIKGNKDLILRA